MNMDGLLDGKTVVVAGGTGSVGRVVVRSLLDAGSVVVVPSRSAGKLAALRETTGAAGGDRLIAIEGDIGSEATAPAVLAMITARAGSIDGAIATLGRFVPAPSVLTAPIADLQQVIDGYLVAHLVVARTLLPALAAGGGSYTFINGPLAFAPMYPGTGLVSVVTAAQAMLARVAMKEMAESAVRVNEVVLYTPFGWGDDEVPRGAVAQEDVGRYLALLASDRGAHLRGQTIHLDTPARVEEVSA